MNNTQLYSEELLLQQVAEGDEAAFRRLFELYTPRLHSFFLKMTKDVSLAKELVQETFLNVWLYRSSLQEVSRPSSYLYRIATNVAVRHLRKEDVQRQIIAGLSIKSQEQEMPLHHMLQVKELQQKITEAVNRLPPQQRQVFYLSREQGLTRSEIAQRMGLSEKTVRNHLTLSLRAIQEFLNSNYQVYIPLFLLGMLLS